MTSMIQLKKMVKELKIMIQEFKDEIEDELEEVELPSAGKEPASDSDSEILEPASDSEIEEEPTERDRIMLSIRQQMSDEENRGPRTWGIRDDGISQTTAELDDMYLAEELRRYDELMANKETDTKTL